MSAECIIGCGTKVIGGSTPPDVAVKIEAMARDVFSLPSDVK
jgi:hypothetical protein